MNPQILGVRTIDTFAPGGGTAQQYVVTYMIGNFGPFTKTYSESDYNAGKPEADMDAAAARLQRFARYVPPTVFQPGAGGQNVPQNLQALQPWLDSSWPAQGRPAGQNTPQGVINVAQSLLKVGRTSAGREYFTQPEGPDTTFDPATGMYVQLYGAPLTPAQTAALQQAITAAQQMLQSGASS